MSSLTDLLQLIGLVVNFFGAFDLKNLKQEKLAKQLLKVYLALDEVTDQGKLILVELRNQESLQYSITMNLLLEQQESINQLIRSLGNQTIQSVLQLHVAQWKGMTFLVERKSSRLGFYLKYLYNAQQVDKERQEFERMIIDRRKKSNESSPFPPKYQNLDAASKARDLELQKELPKQDRLILDSYDQVIRSAEEARRYEDGVFVIASEAHIQEAETVLSELTTVQEQLRSLLVNKFNLTDFI